MKNIYKKLRQPVKFSFLKYLRKKRKKGLVRSLRHVAGLYTPFVSKRRYVQKNLWFF